MQCCNLGVLSSPPCHCQVFRKLTKTWPILGKNSLNPYSIMRRFISITWFESLLAMERVNAMIVKVLFMHRYYHTARFPKSIFLSSTKWCQLSYPMPLIPKFYWRICPSEGTFCAGSLSSDGRFNNPSLHQCFHQLCSFPNKLKYLYKGFSEAFKCKHLQGELEDPEALRINKLRDDLVFMWRLKLYSDVHISPTGNFGSNHESTTIIFYSHHFIDHLILYHPYFLAFPKNPSN